MHAMRKLPVVPICRTSVPLRCRANQNDPSRVPHSPRGAFRDRHGRWARDAMDAMSHETNEHIADGEVVWSWRPKAGVKSVERSTGDGDNKAWSPGRSRISRNPLRRECRLYRLTCGSAACFLLHADHGCSLHPAFPAPSLVEGGIVFHQVGRRTRRDGADGCALVSRWKVWTFPPRQAQIAVTKANGAMPYNNTADACEPRPASKDGRRQRKRTGASHGDFAS
jgi:hypothetical protein